MIVRINLNLNQKLVFPRILTKFDLKRTQTLNFLLKHWDIAQKAGKLSDLNTTSTRWVLNEIIKESEVVETLSDAATISIVYAILFALIFIDYLVYKLTKNARIEKIPLSKRKQSVIFQIKDNLKRRFSTAPTS